MSDFLTTLAVSVPVCVALAGAVWATVRSSMRRLEDKYDDMVKFCCDCQSKLGDRFVSQPTFQNEIDDLTATDNKQWTALNTHGHANGRVTR